MYRSYVIVRYYTCAKKQTNRRESKLSQKMVLLWFDILILYTSFSRALYIAKKSQAMPKPEYKVEKFCHDIYYKTEQ